MIDSILVNTPVSSPLHPQANLPLLKGYLSAKKMEKAIGSFHRFGGWILLLSWMPIIGDPLTFIAGVLRYDFKYFAFIVAMAKGTRYAIVIFLASSLSV